MRLFIDLDQHAAVQDFTIAAPAPPPQFKSQDTIDFLIYFLQAGVVQDMGASFALKFGMVKTGDATNTILAYQTTSTYLTDPNGNVYYQMQVVMNTSQMATAIGTNPSIACTIEIRYQDALAEIIHSLNLAATVFQTILVETGVTPPGVSTGYPDASTIELLVHKNVASGYAGLDSGAHIFGAQIPVDGVTVQILDGQIASAQILAETAASFVTPAINSTVNVTLVSSTGLVIGQYVRLPGAGYYIVQSIPDGTHAVLQNNGDPANAASGTTIVTDTPLLPAQAAAGGGGAPGQAAYTNTTASFVVPAVGASVTVSMTATSWLAGSGYIVFIAGAGFYAVSSIIDANHAVLTNLGYAATNAASGTNIASGAQISPGGLQGPSTTGSSGSNAYDTTSASFIMPAAAASVNVAISNTAWLSVGQEVFIAGAGYFSVASVTSPTVFSATNSNYPGAAAPGATIASGAKVSPAGLIGPQGAGGAGLNAFTTLTSNFTQPAVGSTVTIVVGTTAWMVASQGIYIQAGGYYTISSIGDLTHVTVTNLGSAGNAAAGLIITGSGTQMVSPAGVPGLTGTNAFTVTTVTFTVPTPNATVTVTVGSSGWMAQGQNLYLPGAGYYQVSSVPDATHAVLINSGLAGNATAGNIIPSGTQISPAGAQGATGLTGPAGPTGGIGEAPTDGQTYGRKNSAWTPVIGGGGGGSFNPQGASGGVYDYEEFLWSNLDSARWVSTVSGSAAFTMGSYGRDTTHQVQGAWEMATGGGTSVSATGACLARGSVGLTNQGLILGLGTLDIAFRIALEGTLPPTGIGYFARAGLLFQNPALSGSMPATPTLSQAGTAFIVLDYSPDNNSGLFRIGYVYNNGTVTWTNCSAGPTGDTMGWWELKISAAGLCTAYFNGASIGSVTIPSNTMGQPMSPYFVMFRGVASSANFAACVDSYYLNYPYSR